MIWVVLPRGSCDLIWSAPADRIVPKAASSRIPKRKESSPIRSAEGSNVYFAFRPEGRAFSSETSFGP